MKFLIYLISIYLLVVSSDASAGLSHLKHDGYLRLYHSHSNEYLEIKYEENGTINPEVLIQFNHFMRSREEGATRDINADLLYLLDHLQDHFGADTIEVICGYRSLEFNKKLYTSGHNVARESYHTMGQAADIHIDEISEDVLVSYLKKLDLGGVGYYPRLLMVHADLGLHRFWQEDKFIQRTDIGHQPIVAKTDKLFYFKGDKQILGFQHRGSYELDHFFRGRWQTLLKNDFTIEERSKIILNPLAQGESPGLRKSPAGLLLSLPYGKFRWKTYVQNGSEAYSNEFYFKKR